MHKVKRARMVKGDAAGSVAVLGFDDRELVNRNRFTWVRYGRVFVAKASDFKGLRIAHGFTMISSKSKTGKFVDFELDCVNHDLENEVTGWTYRPTQLSIAARPSLAGVRCEIYNDQVWRYST